MDGWADGHTDDQRLSIMTGHYHEEGYGNYHLSGHFSILSLHFCLDTITKIQSVGTG